MFSSWLQFWCTSVLLVRNWPFPSYLVPLFQNESKCKNNFDLHENEPVVGTRFHMIGFTLRLVLIQRQQETQKWPIRFRTQIQKGLGTGLNVLQALCTLHVPIFWHYFCDVDNQRRGHWRSRHGDWQLHRPRVPYGLWVQGKCAWKVKHTH